MNCFDSFLRVYANKHAYPKERKKSERINQMLLIKQQNHYFIDKIEMVVALSMHICDDSKMAFLQCCQDMLYEWYQDLVQHYQENFKKEEEEEDDFFDQEEYDMMTEINDEEPPQTHYQLLDQFFHSHKDTILHPEYQQALNFENFVELDAHIDQQHYMYTPKALWTNYKQQLFKHKRMYRSMQESYILEAFYYIQFEAFVHVFQDIYGTFQRIHKTFKQNLKKTVQQAVRNIPTYVEAPYAYKNNQTWFETIDAMFEDDPDMDYDMQSEFLERAHLLTDTNYIEMYYQHTLEYKNKPIKTKRTQNVHDYKNINFF